MKFHLGQPLVTPGFPPDASWHRLRASGPVAIQFQAVPVAVLVTWFMGVVWNCGTTATDTGMFPWNIPFWSMVGAFMVIIPCHELLHVLACPGLGFGRQTYLCFWPAKLLPYALHTGPISRRRKFVILLLPFMVLTLLPACVAILFANNHSGFIIYWFDPATPMLALISTMNALASSGDLLMVFSHWRNVPARAQLQGSGWDLYYKVPVS